MQIGGIGPEEQPGLSPESPDAWNEALAAQARVGQPPAGQDANHLNENDLNLVRQWLVEGASINQIGTALSLWPKSVSLSQARLAKRFGVGEPAGWAPFLKGWLTAGQLSNREVASAILTLTTKPGSGPPGAWKALLAALAKTGSSPAELAELGWAVRCSPLALNTAERQVMRLICTGMGTAEVTTAMDRSLDNIKNLRRQILEKFTGFTSRQGQDIHTRIAAGASFLGVLPPDYDPRTVDVAQLHTQAHTLGRPLTVQQAAFLLDALRGVTLDALNTTYHGEIALLAFKLCSLLDLPGAWQAGQGLPVLIEQAGALGLSDPRQDVEEPATRPEQTAIEALPKSRQRTLALAQDKGMLMTPTQAGILYDVSMHRPLREIMAEHGEGLDATMATLGAMMGVAVEWRSGRNIQAFVDTAVAEGLIENRAWPDPARLPDEFAALMNERFGLGREELSLLQALAAEPATGEAEGVLTRVSMAAGQSRANTSVMVVELALRLCPTLPNGTMTRVIGTLQRWLDERNLDEVSPERLIQNACQSPLSARQLGLLYTVAFPPEARELAQYSGGHAIGIYRSLLAIEKRIGLPPDYPEAELLARPVLDAALARKIVSRP